MKKILYSLSIFFLSSLLFPCCTGMDEPYKEFLNGKETIYVGKADSVKIYPGRDRALLRFLLKDPSVTKAKIYWNNKSDSVVLDINKKYPIDTIWLNIDNMKEAVYSFNIITFDKFGNSSVSINAVGQTYGEQYQSSILETALRSAYLNEKNLTQVDLDWSVADQACIGAEITYETTSNENKTVFTSNLDSITKLYNYKQETSVSYRSLFLPEPLAIDTFYTELSTKRVRGVVKPYDRSTWKAYGDDYDKTNVRPPANAIDGNKATVWHMDRTKYPHPMYIDMGAKYTLTGFSFLQRQKDDAVRIIEMRISDDGVKWISLGEFELKATDNNTYQYLDMPTDFTCRYFQLIAKSDYKGNNFTALAEIGAYMR